MDVVDVFKGEGSSWCPKGVVDDFKGVVDDFKGVVDDFKGVVDDS